MLEVLGERSEAEFEIGRLPPTSNVHPRTSNLSSRLQLLTSHLQPTLTVPTVSAY